MTVIETGYQARPQFEPFHLRKQRWAAIVAHRRAGKTVACVNDLLDAALRCQLPEPRFAYIAPFYSQAKDIAWAYLKRFALPIPGAVAHEQELRVDLPNGGRVRLYGADNYERLRGIYLDGVVLDEFGDVDPRAWSEVIRPALADRKGWAVFIGTPKGRNHFADVWKQAQYNPDWYSLMLKASQTGIVSPEELADARASGMSEDQYNQEFECFKPDALVMCHDRARPIADVRPGDAVLTHTGRMRRVDRVMSKPFAGELVRISAYGSRDIVCTPEHPVYVCDPSSQRYEWKRAEDVASGDWLVTPRMHTGAGAVIPEALAKVVAWYVSEGCVSGNALTFSIGAHEGEFVDDLCNALMALGEAPTVVRTGNVETVGVNSVTLSDFLVSQCGSKAHNKRLPIGLLRGHERVVWDTLMNGDGCIHQPANDRHRPVYAYTTVSEGLAQQVQILGASLGYVGTYTTRPSSANEVDGRVIVGGESYCVQMRASSGSDRHTGKTRMAKNGALGAVREVSREVYSGTVHNLSVAGDESYVVNGRAVHNCSFDAAVVGAYYGKLIERAENEGRVGNVPWEPNVPVETWWDLGIDDSTAIWFVQTIGREIRVIDYYENSGVGLEHYAKSLKERDYVYGRHILPHDVEVRELSTGKSRWAFLASLGIKGTVAKKHSVEDGINSVRSILSRCWFDKRKCERGIEALRQYRQDWDDKLKAFKGRPLHDWTSHGSDAFRYGAYTVRPSEVEWVMGVPRFINDTPPRRAKMDD